VKIKVYGIPNCNSVKQARDWLTENGLEYTFIDFKKDAPPQALIEKWLSLSSLDTLLNRKGTTWRQLSDSEKDSAAKISGAIKLMMGKPSLIKRPVIEVDSKLFLGFDPKKYQDIFLI